MSLELTEKQRAIAAVLVVHAPEAILLLRLIVACEMGCGCKRLAGDAA